LTTVVVTKRDGTTAAVAGKTGGTLMEALRDGGVDEIVALCGGCRSCATCHVYIGERWWPMLPSLDPDEADLLDASQHRTTHSRLSCQIVLQDELEGMEVTVAPEE